MVDGRKWEIGSRIECDGQRGTLKYVGKVGNAKGEWLGVDWDDPRRGKHSGTYEGVEYFKARCPTSGSFIRPGKAKFGISCPEAVRRRYGLIEDELAGVDRENLSSLQRDINAPRLEMVGFAKVNKRQSKFDQLRMVGLREQRVSGAGSPGDVARLCPNLEELDLSRNLINSWKIVADICCQLCRLTHLDVSENCLRTDEKLEDLGVAFPTVTHLTMTRMNYSWLDVSRCLPMFAVLDELSLSFNAISAISEPLLATGACLTNVTALTLEGNSLSDRKEVSKLGLLPRLAYLNVNSNKISGITFRSTGPTEKTPLFPALKYLHLCGNDIAEWTSVSELDKLARLEELKFRENPVLRGVTAETARQLIIARVSSLKVLNGTEITYEERRGAEYDYLKLHLSRWTDSESDAAKRDAFVDEHPRYPILVEKYGVHDIPSSRTKTEMKSNVITVEFVCPDEPSASGSVKRKLLKDMEVQKVMGLAQRLFKTGGRIPILSFVQPNLSKDEIPLDKPLQKLSYYSIQSGDRILVR